MPVAAISDLHGNLAAHDAVADADDSPIELDRGEARFVLTVNRSAPEPSVAGVEQPDDADPELQLALFDELPAGRRRLGIELPTLDDVPAPQVHDVRRLSYSALALFERCSYRYFAERVLGLPPRRHRSSVRGSEGLAATEIGDAVHRLLELVPLDDPVAPAREELDRIVRGWYPAVLGEELERIAELVDAYCGSALARRVAALRGARPDRKSTRLNSSH